MYSLYCKKKKNNNNNKNMAAIATKSAEVHSRSTKMKGGGIRHRNMQIERI